MAVVFFNLGSNVGDRDRNLEKAIELLESYEVKILAKSGIYETEPWGVADQADFLNQVVRGETDLSACALVSLCGEIERQLGRIDSFKWGPRVIDVDLLFYDDEVVDGPKCTVPHYLMHKRRFVLKPLSEIAPRVVHPVLKKNVLELLNDCDDKGLVRKV